MHELSNPVLLYYHKTGFDIPCKSTPKETICRKYQSMFYRRNEKNISKCYLLKSTKRRDNGIFRLVPTHIVLNKIVPFFFFFFFFFLPVSDYSFIFNFFHYENMPIQYNDIFLWLQKRKVSDEKMWSFCYFCSKQILWYPLGPSQRGGSNRYPQSMFYSRNKKKIIVK